MKYTPSKRGSWSPGQLLLLVSLLLSPALLQAQEVSDHQYSTEAIQTGLAIYSRECALCHGPQGDLVSGINLRLGQFRTASSDEDLREVISNGAAQGQMPAFNFRDSDISGLIAYIRAGFDPDGVAVRIGDPERGKALFEGKGECASCHRVNGVGPRTAPDLSSIGVLRTPSNLQLNLIDPAAALLPINRPVRIVTQAEETILGRRLNEDTYTVQVIDSEERLRSLRKSELVTYEVSELPSKTPTSLSTDEVADVVGYLLTLRGVQ